MRSHWTARARPYLLWVGVAAVVVGCAAAVSDEADAELAHGRELYQANCMSCHGGATGGRITDVPPPHNAQGHTWHHPDCDLVDITLRGLPPRPGLPQDAPAMPGFEEQLSEDDVQAILAYIKTWWTPDQREFQAMVTEQACP